MRFLSVASEHVRVYEYTITILNKFKINSTFRDAELAECRQMKRQKDE